MNFANIGNVNFWIKCGFSPQRGMLTPIFDLGRCQRDLKGFPVHKRNVFHIYGEAGVVIYENKEWGNTKNFLLSTTSLSQFLGRKR